MHRNGSYPPLYLEMYLSSDQVQDGVMVNSKMMSIKPKPILTDKQLRYKWWDMIPMEHKNEVSTFEAPDRERKAKTRTRKSMRRRWTWLKVYLEAKRRNDGIKWYFLGIFWWNNDMNDHCFIKLYLKEMLGNRGSLFILPCSEELSLLALKFKLKPYLLGVLGILLGILPWYFYNSTCNFLFSI